MFKEKITREKGLNAMESVMEELKKADEIASAIATALSIIDCTIELNEDKVDIIAFLITSELREIFEKHGMSLDDDEEEDEEECEEEYIDEDEIFDGDFEDFLNYVLGMNNKIR